MMEPEVSTRPDAALSCDAATSTNGPRRILYVNTWSSCHGGSSTSLLDIVGHLHPSKYEPLVLCPEPGPLPDRLAQIGVPVTVHSITPLTWRLAPGFAWEIPWYVRFLSRNRISLVHGNTGCWRRSVVMAARLLGIPYVQHVRNPVDNVESDFALRYACRIVTNSDQVGLPLRRHPRLSEKTRTIYNAVDLTRYTANDDRRDELQAADRPILGFVGQIVPRKGIVTAIRALRIVVDAVPEALLVIVGPSKPGDASYEKECRDLVGALKLHDHVRWVGFRTDVPAWMRTFDVFVLPTRSEPFGKVIVEAMAAGCPVVASDVGGIPEIVAHAGLGTLIPPDDPAAAATAVLAFLKDRDLARRVAAAAREHVARQFSLPSMIESLEELYDDILASKPA